MNTQAIFKINRRTLVIDDNPAIQQDFRKILAPTERAHATLNLTEALIFGSSATDSTQASFEVGTAGQGQAGVTMILEALHEKRPYALVFVDMQMPPGWDGARTMQEILQVDPEIQIVICTAQPDYPWAQLFKSLGTQRLNILEKPFNTHDVLRLANELTEKWSVLHHARETHATP
jgi:two-component system, NtrC family, sensor kinase